MDERAVKRLLIIVVVSIIAVMLLKAGLTKTYTVLNKATAEKTKAAAARTTTPQSAPVPPHPRENIAAPMGSAVGETSTLDSTAASGVIEIR